MKRLSIKELKEINAYKYDKEKLIEVIKRAQEPVNQRVRRQSKAKISGSAISFLENKIREIENSNHRAHLLTDRGTISTKDLDKLSVWEKRQLLNVMSRFVQSKTSTIKGARAEEKTTHLVLKGLPDLTDEEIRSRYVDELIEIEDEEERQKRFEEIKEEYKKKQEKAYKEKGYKDFSSELKSSVWRTSLRIREMDTDLKNQSPSIVARAVSIYFAKNEVEEIEEVEKMDYNTLIDFVKDWISKNV